MVIFVNGKSIDCLIIEKETIIDKLITNLQIIVINKSSTIDLGFI